MLKELCRIFSAFIERKGTIIKLIPSLEAAHEHNKTLAMPTYRVIIIFTYNLWYAPTQTDLCQISSPPPKRHLKFPGPGGSGSPFFGGGLFRCARFSSGQIRNAASGSQGRHSGQPSGFELRLLATFLLQSPRGLYSGGPGRADWQEERPEGAVQAQRGDYGLCGAKANSRSFAQSRCFIGTDSKEVRDSRTSTDFGTGFGCREKKTSLTTTESVRSCLAQATELIEQYERLRQQVLCRNLSYGSRIGQAVLVSRGVVAWMRAVSQTVASILPACSTMSSDSNRVPDSLHEDLVRVMGEAVLTLARQEAL
jgi:hypothetical protein